MKKEIHPAYQTAKVTCACGASFAVGSTKEALNVEICSSCHPFYTGNEKVMDTAGRVEKFKARSSYAKAAKDRRAAAGTRPASSKKSK